MATAVKNIVGFTFTPFGDSNPPNVRTNIQTVHVASTTGPEIKSWSFDSATTIIISPGSPVNPWQGKQIIITLNDSNDFENALLTMSYTPPSVANPNQIDNSFSKFPLVTAIRAADATGDITLSVVGSAAPVTTAEVTIYVFAV